MHKWKAMAPADVEGCLADPWRFHDVVFSVPVYRAYLQRNALIHLVFRDTFEGASSQGVKEKIAQAFPQDVTDPSAHLDRQRWEIRPALTPRYGPGFTAYDYDRSSCAPARTGRSPSSSI